VVVVVVQIGRAIKLDLDVNKMDFDGKNEKLRTQRVNRSTDINFALNRVPCTIKL
jgi:hypothetical protein